MIAEYFRQQTVQLQQMCLSDITSRDSWLDKRESYRQQLLEMLGLDPLPEKTPLQPVVTGTVEHEEFTVENLHFQSRPGLYVTANLYVPRNLESPAPAVLYVCGHGRVKQDGISYGNKVSYQHHGAWFARNGYVCLTIDTLQLGEIEGIHHGTYRYDMWWWLNRGYTPAGVEAWNCIRALDYLETREEVDSERMGVTGRSGGGAYSWWIAAIDQRIKAAVPVAGITDLRNHVVDGCVEGHCDCMYLSNTYRWDYPLVAALVAPRPLLISNTDRDRIFPLDGVVRTHSEVRRIYDLLGETENLALNITAGPHKDTQELRVHAFRWFNAHLRSDDSLIDQPAVKLFEPEQLRVFSELPSDQRNTEIQETFITPAEPPPVPTDTQQWEVLRNGWLASIREKCFAAWPKDPPPLSVQATRSEKWKQMQLDVFEFTSQQSIRLPLYVLRAPAAGRRREVRLTVLDADGWTQFLATVGSAFPEAFPDESLPAADEDAWHRLKDTLSDNCIVAFVAPRGIGPTAWDQSEKKQVQHQRRFYLLGQTLDGMRVWDVCRAVEVAALDDVPLTLTARQRMAGVALYAAVFGQGVQRLELAALPPTHRDGPYLLNVRRVLDLPQTLALAVEATDVVLPEATSEWAYARQVARLLGRQQALVIQPAAE
jgi:cephalosporin-C deacetylase-like acetyl esterase